MQTSAKYQCDVVVVGSGGSGLSAALTASTQGSKVLIVEKADVFGGTTALSGSGTWIPRHHYQAELGVEDTREDVLSYLRGAAPDGWHNVEDPLWVSFTDHAPEMLKFLEAHSPLQFGPCRESDPYAEITGGKNFGRMVSPRPLSPTILGALRNKLRGPQYTPWLNYEEALDSPIYAMPKRWLLRFSGRTLYRILTKKRVMGNALVVGLLKGCLDKGCELWLQTRAEKLIRSRSRITGIRVRRGTEVIDVETRKGVVLASGGFEWNQEMMTRYFKYPHALPKGDFEGTRFTDQTLEGLAAQIGLDPNTLVETAKRFSDFARRGVDEDFARGASRWDRTRAVDPRQKPNPVLGSIEVPPFYAMPFIPSFLGTKGGPRTNSNGQVVDQDERVINGLYAAGDLMANPFGTKGMGGGTTIGPVLTWGYICGLNVHQETVSEN